MVRFGPFAIDPRTWTLTRDGAALDLSPRLVEILAYLVERDGAVATKEELLDRFWPDVHVTENTLTRAIADIRKAVGDAADRPTVIHHRRGDGDVIETRIATTGSVSLHPPGIVLELDRIYG